MALVENIHDLDPIEIALSYQRLLMKFNSKNKWASVLEKNVQQSHYLRRFSDPYYPNWYSWRFHYMGHGRAIINIEDLDIQTDIYQK
jgi:ParB family chromosome partitioning protein